MPIKRKKAGYLNQLRHDVDDVLVEIQQAGTDVDSAAYDLSKILACDIKSDDDMVKGLYLAARNELNKLGKLLDSFKTARDKYSEFF